ncbi:arginine--tRNA ligase [Abiotrophia defectiva]
MNQKSAVVSALSPVLAEHLNEQAIEQLIEVPSHAEHGDLAFPVFQLAKVFRKAPQAIAQEVAEQVDASKFDKVVAMGPYVNFFLKRGAVVNETLHAVLEGGASYGQSDLGQGRNVVIDMSSPNIAKPMSMGHLRSTVIGNSISLILAKLGYQPVRVNHLGDWGTQFGKLIVAYQGWGDEAKVKADPVKELVKLYVDFHEKAETQPELEDQARAIFKRLEDGDPEMLALWQWFREESLKEFQKVYDLLEVKFDSYNGEAFYNDKMDEIVDLLEEKGLLSVDNGATLVHLEDETLPPALIKKSDGSTLYLTRDLATAYYRKRTYDFAKNLYVMGSEQSVHFKQLQTVLEMMGNEWAKDMAHVPFGLITLNGKKLSTRKGKIVLLEEVLKEAISLARQQVELKNPGLENKDQVARQVGVGAVVFHDLKTERMNSFDFNLEEIVQFEGETGPYVQYTHARSRSILSKYGQEVDLSVEFDLSDDYAWEVAKKLADYPRIIRQAGDRYEPSVVAKYLVQLAQLFNKYYANSRILDQDAGTTSRIALVAAVAQVLKDGLHLLGLHAPDKM